MEMAADAELNHSETGEREEQKDYDERIRRTTYAIYSTVFLSTIVRDKWEAQSVGN